MCSIKNHFRQLIVNDIDPKVNTKAKVAQCLQRASSRTHIQSPYAGKKLFYLETIVSKSHSLLHVGFNFIGLYGKPLKPA